MDVLKILTRVIMCLRWLFLVKVSEKADFRALLFGGTCCELGQLGRS